MPERELWEATCERCGRCCYEKVEFEGVIYYTDAPCVHLDSETRLCRVYNRRHQQKPDCSPLTPAVLKMGVLPADCPYVKEQQNYLPPKMWDDEES